MKQSTTLGHSTLNINRIGLGCMGMSEFHGSFDEAESIKTLYKAIDLGTLKVELTADDLARIAKALPKETSGARY